MIQEHTIERVLERLESGRDDQETEIRDFAAAQPYLMEYLTHEDTGAFTSEEQELLIFAALVIRRSADAEGRERRPVRPDDITLAEEANYGIAAAAPRGDFRERLTPFFAASPEEELLAFVEDLAADEEVISREAREPFFITLKTVVDVITQPG